MGNQNDKLNFTCWNCQKENTYTRSQYIDGKEEYFLEAEGNTPTKEVIISCTHCKLKNKVNVPYC
jgi:hypothetical protein